MASHEAKAIVQLVQSLQGLADATYISHQEVVQSSKVSDVEEQLKRVGWILQTCEKEKFFLAEQDNSLDGYQIDLQDRESQPKNATNLHKNKPNDIAAVVVEAANGLVDAVGDILPEEIGVVKQELSSTSNEERVMPIEQMATRRMLRIFLCHSSADKPAVRELYQQLKDKGFDPWLDEEEILPGQDWDQEIRKAMRRTDLVIACLSRASITKAGYLQKELRHALDVADEQPDGTIFLIPVKLEECDVPERLRKWQWVNLFEERGLGKLLRTLQVRAANIT